MSGGVPREMEEADYNIMWGNFQKNHPIAVRENEPAPKATVKTEPEKKTWDDDSDDDSLTAAIDKSWDEVEPCTRVPSWVNVGF